MAEEATRPADILQAHPDTSDVTDSGRHGDIVFTAGGNTWVLDSQSGADGE
ncbi:hypothetical protein ABZ371_02765 [Streptomyces sp. NPDC005899]|uniref:hypothetical protein n=1 Tax=Streptomyces sp. NPDC005899 TaxID=3155716 RepID=UPI0033CF2AB5